MKLNLHKSPLILLAASMLLTACGASDNDPGVGGVTAGEAQALNDAAEMLDRRSVDRAVTTTPTQEPAEASSMSNSSAENSADQP